MATEESSGGRPLVVDRATIEADLTACREDLRGLLAGASADELRRSSNGTAWTNEQLLFHMVFGFLVVRRLLPLVRFLGRRPPRVGRAFARVLDAARVPFHWVNYAGSCGGALVFDRSRMGGLCDRTIAFLVRSLESETEQRLTEGMPFPPGWDPYFTRFMTLADVYAYPVLHYRHHRAQLTLPGLGQP